LYAVGCSLLTILPCIDKRDFHLTGKIFPEGVKDRGHFDTGDALVCADINKAGELLGQTSAGREYKTNGKQQNFVVRTLNHFKAPHH
jgi:hypothetical protein